MTAETEFHPGEVPRGHRGWRFWTKTIGPWLVAAVAAWDFSHPELALSGAREAGVFWGMAPITAVLLILLSGALGVQRIRLLTRFRTPLMFIGCTAVTVIAVHILWCRAKGVASPGELWFEARLSSADRVPSRTAAQMAALLLCSVFGLLALYSPLSKRTAVCNAGIVVALAVLLYGFVAFVAFAAGNPPGVASGWLPQIRNAMVSILVFNFLLLLAPNAINRLRSWFFGAEASGEQTTRIPREERLALALLAGVVVVATVASVWYLRLRTRYQQSQTIETVVTLTDLKMREVTEWRRERLADARALTHLTSLTELANARANAAANGALLRNLVEWLPRFAEDYGYTKIIVFNAAMEPVAAYPAGARADAANLGEKLAALKPDSGITELPPYLIGTKQVRWDLVAPLLLPGSTTLNGAVWLQTDPGKSIFPGLKWWPNDYKTGQTVLWSREGDRLVAMSGFRPAPGVTEAQTLPFAETRTISTLPANSLLGRVLRREVTAAEGLDHQGVPILGYGVWIRDSPWLLTTRVDSSEVYQPLRRDAWALAAAIVGLLGTAGATTSWLWQQRQRNLLHARLTAELEQKRLAARLGMVMRHAHDMIFLTGESRQVVDANQQAVDTYGWTKEELLRLTTKDLRAPEAMSSFAADAKLADAPGGATYETVHRRKDGTTFPVEISVRRVELEGERQMLSIIRDISERRQAEAKLRDSEEKFSKAFQANPIGIALTDLATGQFIEVNESYCRLVHYAAPDIVGRTSVELGIWSSGDDRREMFKALFDGGSLRNFEMQIRTREGEPKTISVNAELIELNGKRTVLALIEDITDRKQAEVALRESEEKFSKAFQANPSSIVISEFASGRFVEVNESFCRLMRYSSPELIGRTSVELAIWGSADERRRIFEPLLNGGVLRNLEARLHPRDSETKIVLINAELIELNGQRYVLSLIEDVTDRKQAEAALRASEERYRLIADNTSDLIWLYDRAAERFTYASPASLPLLGYRPEEIVGRKLLDFVAPTSKDTARRALERAMGSAEGTRAPVHLAVELEQQRKDGSLVPTEVVTSVLLNASGQITHILGVTRDITERRKARETLEKFNTQLEQQVETRTAELAARNREIEALVESIPDTVLLCDERGELVTSHFAQNRASAFPFASAGGGDGLSKQHPVLLEIAHELHTVAWASQEAIMLEFDRNIDGVDYSIEARATPAGDHRLLILLRDISARKRSERVVQANLERERQLSDMKSQFVSVASHEFRTPLAAAVGSIELMERHAAKLTETKRVELLGRVKHSLGRLTDIMNNVLQLSRADSGRVKVKLMNVDLGRFAQDVVNEVAEGDRQAHTFSFQQSGGPGPVPIDTNLLNHILSNLVGNAARYSPAGTQISVTLVIEPEAFALTISDEGIGIPEAERDRIFEPFVRGSNVGQIGGTGLGLNIVKRYTEMLGGRIEVLPSARGAVFRVRVPISPLPASS